MHPIVKTYFTSAMIHNKLRCALSFNYTLTHYTHQLWLIQHQELCAQSIFLYLNETLVLGAYKLYNMNIVKVDEESRPQCKATTKKKQNFFKTRARHKQSKNDILIILNMYDIQILCTHN